MDPGKAPDARDLDLDQARGALVDEVDPRDTSRVTTKDGLIHTVDGKPVKEYTPGSVPAARRSSTPATSCPATGRARGRQDLKTGKIKEGVDGGTTDLIDPENLHPLLRENYKDMGDWQHPVLKNDTDMQQKPVLGENGKALLRSSFTDR